MKQNAKLSIIRHRKINMKMLSGMVEPNGDPTTLKKEERAMRPTPEVVWKWSLKLKYANQDNTMYKHWFIFRNLDQTRQNWAHTSNRNRLLRRIKTSKTSLTGPA